MLHISIGDYNKPLFPDPLSNDQLFFATQMFLNLMKELILLAIVKWLRMVRMQKYNIRLTSSGHLVKMFWFKVGPYQMGL